MDNNKINEYVFAFRSALRKYLKKGVSIKTVSYPFDSGAVNVINFNKVGEDETEVKPQSDSFADALSKTNFFKKFESQPMLEPDSMLMTGDNLIFIKNDSSASWSNSAAKADVDKFLDFIDYPKDEPAEN